LPLEAVQAVDGLSDLASPVDQVVAVLDQIQAQTLRRLHFLDLIRMFLKEQQEHREPLNNNGRAAAEVVLEEMAFPPFPATQQHLVSVVQVVFTT
jgi:hypothetical protein